MSACVPFLPGDAIKIVIAMVVVPFGWKLLGYRSCREPLVLPVDDEEHDNPHVAVADPTSANLRNADIYAPPPSL